MRDRLVLRGPHRCRYVLARDSLCSRDFGGALERIAARDAAGLVRAGLEAASVQDLVRWWTASGTRGAPGGTGDRQEIVDAIVREVGQPLSLFVLWRQPELPRGLPRSDVPDLPSEPDDVDPVAPPVAPTQAWIEIRCLGPLGESYSGASFRMRLPRGDVLDGELDGESAMRVDPLETDGTCHFELARDSAPNADVAAVRAFVPGPGMGRLRAGKTLGFRPGRAHTVIIEPQPHQTRSYPGSMFATNSALPNGAISNLVSAAIEAAAISTRLAIFGHSDVTGDDEYNKLLSDRRAEVAFTLITDDFARFKQLCEDEAWTVEGQQAMLRAIGGNPGAIDGDPGAMTREAAARFVDNYNAGLFHRDATRAPEVVDLEPGQDLDGDRKIALIDAFHAYLGARVDAGTFYGPRFAGCGEFNPAAEEHALNRRVSLTVFGQDVPEASVFPCQTGDASACAIDDHAAHRCVFFRQHIGVHEKEEHGLTFWDHQWVRTPSGGAHLSMLTSAVDSDDVELIVFYGPGGRADEDSGRGERLAPPHVLATLRGLVRAGVAYGLWHPADGYDPFDPEQWFRAPGEQEGVPWQPGYQPPGFMVTAQGAWGIGGPPGHRSDRVVLDSEDDGPIVLLRNDGKILLLEKASDLRTMAPVWVNGTHALRDWKEAP